MKLKPELLTFWEYLGQNKIDLFLKMGHSRPLLMSMLCFPRPTEVSLAEKTYLGSCAPISPKILI